MVATPEGKRAYRSFIMASEERSPLKEWTYRNLGKIEADLKKICDFL